MLVLQLCKQLCPDKIPLTPTIKLGDGADGEVFEIQENPEMVMKLCVLHEDDANVQDSFAQVERVLGYLQANSAPTYARVYSFGSLGMFERDLAQNQRPPYILYYYVMEKLHKITEDEKRVFHSVVSHEDRGIKKNFSPAKIKEMIFGMSGFLDFDAEKVIFFCDNFEKTPISHMDIHVRNIMKDSRGNFKLVDFDRAQLR